ncbi:MAG: hypothetical protein B6242_12290 [Anaerolineaceae bacterium 4572_78]|nr:MAG: hypothetical protein B6242_12290 [Anaerolineaceae bacterium 4572_78]
MEKLKTTGNKRYRAIIWAIIMSSIVAVSVSYRCALTGDEVIQLYKTYALLIGSLCGAYQTVQSITDHKKLKEGNGN